MGAVEMRRGEKGGGHNYDGYVMQLCKWRLCISYFPV